MSVVAHPPCRAWSAYCAHQAKPEVGEKELGPWCVEQVRRWGGVLEHPAYSRLWDACGLPKPGDGVVGGLWSERVNQSWWDGDRVKRTWLLFGGVRPEEVEIPFRLHDPRGDREVWNRMSKAQRARTGPEMARWLVGVAGVCRRSGEVAPPPG